MKFLIYLVCFAAATAAVFVVGRSALGRELNAIELVVGTLAFIALIAKGRAVILRRKRYKLEEMRDSALW
ncbi:hypothetical protein [Caenimonas soli]|uniref:hypothetical protein n=1 Tax=Caenimonas soli TaxID=2735555 RepID=UPI001555EC20|nr:hypothetical protein [Caenimonas soli]NPC57815.1 hypothetical protein [Caenimonas soli]